MALFELPSKNIFEGKTKTNKSISLYPGLSMNLETPEIEAEILLTVWESPSEVQWNHALKIYTILDFFFFGKMSFTIVLFDEFMFDSYFVRVVSNHPSHCAQTLPH